MTDLEMIRLCAEAMEIVNFEDSEGGGDWYDPLHHNTHALALIQKFRLKLVDVACNDDLPMWLAIYDGRGGGPSTDLHSAIVECVAKMQKARKEVKPPDNVEAK